MFQKQEGPNVMPDLASTRGSGAIGVDAVEA